MNREKVNWKSISTGFVILLIGAVAVIGDAVKGWSAKGIFVNIGCSLIASGSIVILTALLFERETANPLKGSGARRVYMTRAEMNRDCDALMKECRYQIDVIGFGQKTFRTTETELVKELLDRGVNFRFLTMEPDGEFLKERERAEKEQTGQIRNTIEQLVSWANELNGMGYRGHISVKAYNTMTLEFYWRVDDALFLGPYWYGRGSQQTISYQYGEGSVFGAYKEYYEKLWEDEALTRTLVE